MKYNCSYREVLALLSQEQDKTVEYRLKLWNNGRKTSPTRHVFLFFFRLASSKCRESFTQLHFHSVPSIYFLPSKKSSFCCSGHLSFCLHSFCGFVFQRQLRSSSSNFSPLKHQMYLSIYLKMKFLLQIKHTEYPNKTDIYSVKHMYYYITVILNKLLLH